MAEILIKRLLSLSRIYLIIFGFSMVALIHKLDSMELQKDIRALDLVSSVNKIMSEDRIDMKQLQSKAKIWLELNNKDLAKQHIKARQKLVDAIRLSGVNEMTIAFAKGRVPVAGEQHDNFSLLHIVDVEEDLKKITSPIYTSAELTVNETFKRFMYLTKPRTLKVVIDVEQLDRLRLPVQKSNLSKPENKTESGTMNPPVMPPDLMIPFGPVAPPMYPAIMGSAEKRLRDVDFDGNNVLITYITPLTLSNMAQQTPSEQPPMDKFPTKIVDMNSLSIYGLMKSENDEITALRNNVDRLAKHRLLYGNMKFDLAQQFMYRDFNQAYTNISIFGFDFSTRRYPLAVLFMSIGISIGIYWTLNTGKKNKMVLFTHDFHEDIMYGLMSNKFSRSILWIILPVIAVFASLPIFDLSQSELLVIGLGILAMVIIGSSSLLASQELTG